MSRPPLTLRSRPLLPVAGRCAVKRRAAPLTYNVSDPMNMKLVRTLGVFLSASLLANAYLYMEMSRFKEAWLTQFIATSKVESILKASSADLSFDNIKQISISAFGKESVHIVNLENEFTEYGSDRLALGVNDTLLLFKNGFYHGSKANLPNH